MLDAIAGLSALTAGMITPVGLRRAYALTESTPASRTSPQAEDRLELTPGHIHDHGSTCPVCGTAAKSPDADASPTPTRDQQAPTGEKQSILAALGLWPTPAEQEKIEKLKQRDQEVRTHEQAHKAAGGQHAGAATYTYETGPDGRRYAVGGEVSVDISPVPGDPQATITKMQQIRRAALAPAQPSSQDRQVAAQASRIEAEARAELARKTSEASGPVRNNGQKHDEEMSNVDGTQPASPYTPEAAGEPGFKGSLLNIAI